MEPNNKWTIAMIGGGKISGATLFELLDRKRLQGGVVRLFGRSRDKLERNMDIADVISPPKQRRFNLEIADDLDQAL